MLGWRQDHLGTTRVGQPTDLKAEGRPAGNARRSMALIARGAGGGRGEVTVGWGCCDVTYAAWARRAALVWCGDGQ